MTEKVKSTRGFASMSPELQKMIARKGGEAVSKNRAHMSEIGRRGGLVHPKREDEVEARRESA